MTTEEEIGSSKLTLDDHSSDDSDDDDEDDDLLLLQPSSSFKTGSSFSTAKNGTTKRTSSRIAHQSAVNSICEANNYALQIAKAEKERAAKRIKIMKESLKRSEKRVFQQNKIDQIHNNDEHKDEDMSNDDNDDFDENDATKSKDTKNSKRDSSNDGAAGDSTDGNNQPSDEETFNVDREAVRLMTGMNINTSTRYLSSRRTLLPEAKVGGDTTAPVPMLYTCIYQAIGDLQKIVHEELSAGREQLHEEQRQFLNLIRSNASAPSSLVELMQCLAAGNEASATNEPVKPPPPVAYPRRLIQWLFVLACSPAQRSQHSDAVAADAHTADADSTLILAHAQRAAYELLIQHWSLDPTDIVYYYSYPSSSSSSNIKQRKASTFFISLKAMTDQLRQWYGLIFLSGSSDFRVPKKTMDATTSDDHRGDNYDGCAQLTIQPSNLWPSSSSSAAASRTFRNSSGSSKEHFIDPSPSPCTYRFLHLWSVALRSNRVQIHAATAAGETLPELRQCVHDTLCGVLWAVLDPKVGYGSATRGFSGSDDDPIILIRNIVQSIVLFCSTLLNNRKDEFFTDIADSIISVSTRRLGPGLSGTDACDDVHAWLCLSTMLRCLCSSPSPRTPSEYNINDGLTDFRLRFVESILSEAFPIAVPPSSCQRNSSCWSQQILAEDDRLRKCFEDLRYESKPSIHALLLSVLSLNRLSIFFPLDDPPKFMAIADASSICFLLGMKGLYCEMTSLVDTVEKDENDIYDRDNYELSSCNVELKRFYQIFELIEVYCQSTSSQARNLVMQSVCFPRGTHGIESIRSYILRAKERFEAYSTLPTPKNQKQKMIDSFFYVAGKENSDNLV